VFNEFNARSIESRLNVFSGLLTNPIFLGVIVVTVGVQILVVEFGGKFTSTTGLSLVHWGWSALMAFGTTPVGVLMRFIPVSENPDSFADFYSSAYNVSVVVA
jgi:Ca2+-transporting ATPase